MQKPPIHPVPPQSVAIYKVITGENVGYTAQQIAQTLSISPNTVYRAIKPLLDLGMVEELPTHPLSYAAVPHSLAEKSYLRLALASFRKEFGIANTQATDDSLPTITYIKDRKSLRIITEQEAQKAQESISFITSGHAVADSTVAIYRKAVHRGLRLRVIIENNPKSKTVDLEAYRIIGAEARHLSNLGLRLFVFDKKTAVLTSYDPKIPSRAFGIRFTYGPVATQLEQLFEQRWDQATVIKL